MFMMMKPKALALGSSLRTFSHQRFITEHLETCGVDIGSRSLNYQNYSMKFHIWSIPCHYKYEQLRKPYYLKAQTAIILYDISETNLNLYDKVKYWAEDFWANNGKGLIPIVLAGNKIDLREDNIHTITYIEGKRLAEKISYEKGVEVSFVEISAKTRKNVNKTLDLPAELFIKSSTTLS